MKESAKMIVEELLLRYPALQGLRGEIERCFAEAKATYDRGGKLLVCGNGGSAADSEHIVGELLKSFRKKRGVSEEILQKLRSYGEDGIAISENLEGALPCISLTSHIALSTAYANDREPQATFAQQLLGLGNAEDTLLALSTSGNSVNCVYAALVAKAKGMRVLAFTGERESKLSALADVCVRVPERETFKVQELHLPLYHALCACLEEEFF